MNKAVVVYSGGMDSFTLLNDILEQRIHSEVYAVSVNYGQKHDVELIYAMQFCQKKTIPHKVVDLCAIRGVLGGSSLTSDAAVPHGHYEDESMRSTVVPNRNMILLSVAAAYAMSVGADTIYTGVHAGDHAIYPDCRPDFIDSMKAAFLVSTYDPIYLRAPYLHKSKIEIARIGYRLGLNYGEAWTCYDPQYNEKGEVQSCGKCGSCQERIEAIVESCAVDTMRYV